MLIPRVLLLVVAIAGCSDDAKPPLQGPLRLCVTVIDTIVIVIDSIPYREEVRRCQIPR